MTDVVLTFLGVLLGFVVGGGLGLVTARRLRQEAARAEREAEAVRQAKNDFLAAISHEIRTPLNGVVGMAELLVSSDLDESQRETAQTLHEAAMTLVGVIDDVMDFSKVEAGEIELEAAPFDLRATVRDVADLARGRAADKGLELIVDHATSCPDRFVADAGRIRQILSQLVGNAVKFTDEGEVRIGVRAGRDDGGPIDLHIEVADTGAGIESERLAGLFDEFHAGDGSTTRRHGGLGLGLAISRRMARRMGGDLTVRSAPGAGATFTLNLRLAKAAEQDATPAGPTACVVDPDPAEAEATAERIRAWGLQCETMGAAAQALAVIRERAERDRAPDVVIVREHMAGLDGRTFAELLAADNGCAGVRVVIQDDAETDAELRAAVRGEAPERPEDWVEAAKSELRGPRVLVAEDNPVNQTVMRRLLEGLGCAVDVAEDGRVALRRAQERAYDLILMDCQMPVMDGYRAAAAIRRLEGGPGATPIVAVTANAMPGDREKAMQAGMDDYLAKPVTERALAAKVSEWTGLRLGELPTSGAASLADDKLAELEQLAAGDTEFLVTLIEQFEGDAVETAATLRSLFEEGRVSEMSAPAHRLKSGAGAMGASDLLERCRRIEKLEVQPEDLGAELDRLDAEIRSAVAGLRAHFGLDEERAAA